MSKEDREAFEAWKAGESTFEPNTHGDDTPFYIAWTAWKSARDHYAPKLTEKEAVEKAIVAYVCDLGWPVESIHPDMTAAMTKALSAAGVRFKEET